MFLVASLESLPHEAIRFNNPYRNSYSSTSGANGGLPSSFVVACSKPIASMSSFSQKQSITLHSLSAGIISSKFIIMI